MGSDHTVSKAPVRVRPYACHLMLKSAPDTGEDAQRGIRSRMTARPDKASSDHRMPAVANACLGQ